MNAFIEKIKTFTSSLLTSFSYDIGIDLGTANTLVYVKGKGIVINEPSVVAVNQKTGRVVAVGAEAKSMLGRTPPHIKAIRPLVDGVISDYEVTEEMLGYLIAKAQRDGKKIIGPRVVVGVPCMCTNVETRAVRDAAKSAGARKVYIVEEPMAAAIGIRLPIKEPVGNMVVDIGGGTTDIAVISLGGIVASKNLKIAGDKMNNDITAYIRSEFKILVGERTVEDLKMKIGHVISGEHELQMTVRGRDLVTGLPREVVITDVDIREAMSPSVSVLVDSIKEVLESTPPEVLSDVMHRGLFLVGGGALIGGLQMLLKEELVLPVHVAAEPLTAVARGAGVILEDIKQYEDVLINNEDTFTTKA